MKLAALFSFITFLALAPLAHAGPFDPQEPPRFQVARFNGNAVVDAIQCEMGLFARDTKRSRLDPSLRAQVAFTATDEVNRGWGISLGFLEALSKILQTPSLSYNSTETQKRNDIQKISFNLNEGNVGGCRKNRPPVYVYDCLIEKTELLKITGGIAHCDVTTSALGKFNASAKILVWYVNPGFSFDYDVKRTYFITSDSPIPKPG